MGAEEEVGLHKVGRRAKVLFTCGAPSPSLQSLSWEQRRRWDFTRLGGERKFSSPVGHLHHHFSHYHGSRGGGGTSQGWEESENSLHLWGTFTITSVIIMGAEEEVGLHKVGRRAKVLFTCGAPSPSLQSLSWEQRRRWDFTRLGGERKFSSPVGHLHHHLRHYHGSRGGGGGTSQGWEESESS